MSTSKYRKIRKRQLERERAKQPLETLLSGKAGPLPMDNDQRMPQKSAEPTKGKTPSAGSVESLGPYLSDVARRIKADHPHLTDEQLTSMLAEM